MEKLFVINYNDNYLGKGKNFSKTFETILVSEVKNALFFNTKEDANEMAIQALMYGESILNENNECIIIDETFEIEEISA